MIATFVLGSYSLTFSFIFVRYLQKFLQDPTTSNSDRASWIVLILASLLWPISLPISALERNIQNRKPSFQSSESQIGLIYIDPYSKNFSEFSSNLIEQEKVEV